MRRINAIRIRGAWDDEEFTRCIKNLPLIRGPSGRLRAVTCYFQLLTQGRWLNRVACGPAARGRPSPAGPGRAPGAGAEPGLRGPGGAGPGGTVESGGALTGGPGAWAERRSGGPSDQASRRSGGGAGSRSWRPSPWPAGGRHGAVARGVRRTAPQLAVLRRCEFGQSRRGLV